MGKSRIQKEIKGYLKMNQELNAIQSFLIISFAVFVIMGSAFGIPFALLVICGLNLIDPSVPSLVITLIFILGFGGIGAYGWWAIIGKSLLPSVKFLTVVKKQTP